MGCGGSKQTLVKDTHQRVARPATPLAFNVWEAVLDFLDFRDLLRVAPTSRIIHKTTGRPEILRKFQVHQEHKPLKRLDTLTEYQTVRPPGPWFAVDGLAASLELTPKFQSPTGLHASTEAFRFSTDHLRLSAEHCTGMEGVMDSLDKVLPSGVTKLELSSISEAAELPSSPERQEIAVNESAHFPPAEETSGHPTPPMYKFLTQEDFEHALWTTVREGRTSDMSLIMQTIDIGAWRQVQTLNRIYGEDGVSLLAVTVSSGSSELVRALLQAFPRLDVEEGYSQKAKNKGMTIVRKLRPLQFAASLGAHRSVELLLGRGSRPDLSGISKSSESGEEISIDLGAPPLYICINPHFYNSRLNIPGLRYAVRGSPAETDYLLCAQTLLSHGASADIPTNDPLLPTPLFAAVDRPEFLGLLLRHGASPNAVNEKGQTPLFVLCDKTDEAESLKLLIENGALVDPPTCRPLFIALSHKRLGLVKLLRASGAQVNGTTDNPSALQVAISANDAGICRMILGWSELQIDWLYRQNGKNMFHRIAQNKGDEIFDLLVAHRSREELKVVSEALNQSAGKNPNEGDTLPVLYAFPDLKLVRKMVEFGTDIKRLNLLKCMKAYRGDKPVVQTLLDFGLDANTEWEGQTPLWWAHEEGKTELIILLCKAGAQLETRNKLGRTVLLEACLKGATAEVRLLLRCGADLGAVAEGKTAESLILTDFPGKSDDTKTQLADLLRGWKS